MGLNAPISEEAEFKYTTALLKLLSKNSRNKFRIGDRSFIFGRPLTARQQNRLKVASLTCWDILKKRLMIQMLR